MVRVVGAMAVVVRAARAARAASAAAKAAAKAEVVTVVAAMTAAAATGRRRRGFGSTTNSTISADHRGLADQVEAIRALLQSLRELV